MSDHFIKNIEIKNFKCFKDFKAEGFGRVNLIGGKNNVGKTAFMEACYILSDVHNFLEYDLFNKLLEIQTARNVINMLVSKTDREEDIRNLIKNNLNFEIITRFKDAEFEEKLVQSVSISLIMTDIFVHNSFGLLYDYIECSKENLLVKFNEEQTTSTKRYKFNNLIENLNLYLTSTKVKFSRNFISSCLYSNSKIEDIVGETKLDNKYKQLNQYLLLAFDIESIDIIKNEPMLKIKEKYYKLSNYGEGIKNFISIIASLLILKNKVIFIDELENGIHYTNLDQLWEIILTISKQQNVQVFATTHSKECIESYARVAKKLEDEEIGFIELGRDDDNKIESIIYSYEWLIDEVSQNHEVRGW